jgi:fluoride exporter
VDRFLCRRALATVTTRHPLHVSMVAGVALGGAVGAVLRYSVSGALPDTSTGFPWTVFAINVVGCFLLALLPAFAAVRRRPLLPPMLGTGVLGGFTTLSTYAEQSRGLVASGHTATAAAYVVGTLAACLLAVAVADRFSSAAARAEFEEEEGDL